MQEHKLKQTAAINTVKQHITNAIKDLKTEPTNLSNGIAFTRQQLNSRQRTNSLNQPLQTL
jgi:flagellar biosynthesis/type III secretory pathway chaperone